MHQLLPLFIRRLLDCVANNWSCRLDGVITIVLVHMTNCWAHNPSAEDNSFKLSIQPLPPLAQAIMQFTCTDFVCSSCTISMPGQLL